MGSSLKDEAFVLLNPKDLSYLERRYWFKSLVLNTRTRVPILRVCSQIPAMWPQSEPGKQYVLTSGGGGRVRGQKEYKFGTLRYATYKNTS